MLPTRQPEWPFGVDFFSYRLFLSSFIPAIDGLNPETLTHEAITQDWTCSTSQCPVNNISLGNDGIFTAAYTLGMFREDELTRNPEAPTAEGFILLRNAPIRIRLAYAC